MVDSAPGSIQERPTVGAADSLVARARDGDVRAFEGLLDARLPRLVRLAAAILGNEADARDAVQQACVDAWTELRGLRSANRFDAWLGRIVVNECRTMLRSRSRRFAREEAVSDVSGTTDYRLSRSAVAGPEERVEALDELNRAFDKLEPDARVLLALHHLHDWSVADIATGSRLSQATVKWRLHRARLALRQALEDGR